MIKLDLYEEQVKKDNNQQSGNEFKANLTNVIKIVVEAYRGEMIKLLCLDYGFKDNVIWKKVKKKIPNKKSNSNKIKEYLSNKRVYVNEMNELKFERVLYGDTEKYSCFVENIPVVTVDLIIKHKILPNTNNFNKKYGGQAFTSHRV